MASNKTAMKRSDFDNIEVNSTKLKDRFMIILHVCRYK